jgi:hypothetical protein
VALPDRTTLDERADRSYLDLGQVEVHQPRCNNCITPSKLRGISLADFIDLIEASFKEFDPMGLTVGKITREDS